MADKWVIPWEVKNLIVNQGHSIRGHTMAKLLDETTFYRDTGFWMSGITMHRNRVLLADEVTDSYHYEFIAVVVVHELGHVAQQMDWGHVRFMLQYGWEAVCCGFRYSCLKKKSIEKEAYEHSNRFANNIGYRNFSRVAMAVDSRLKKKYIKDKGDSAVV